MAVWEQILLGITASVVLFLFWPGVKSAMQKSKEAENPDWPSALIPIGLIILFVMLLIIVAKS